MKFNVEIDCTPEEARAFLGLPDVSKMQESLVKEIQARMEENIRSMDPDALMKMWGNLGIPNAMEGFSGDLAQGFAQNMGEMQKMFWENMKTSATQASRPSSDKKDK